MKTLPSLAIAASSALLLVSGSGQFATHSGDNLIAGEVVQSISAPLSGAVVKAWQQAGAEVGWMGSIDSYGIVGFRQESDEKKTELPGFKFRVWAPGVIGKLPDPLQAFGLDLSNTRLLDTDMKELAGVKNLWALELSGNQVTDAGLKELV